ncbi:MAG: hypothetical protein R2751_16000 [Bacteroidales bacterium]
MYEGLEKRGVPLIRLYEDFMAAADQVIYYGTDTHWKESGLNIALDNTLDVFGSLRQHSDKQVHPKPHPSKN